MIYTLLRFSNFTSICPWPMNAWCMLPVARALSIATYENFHRRSEGCQSAQCLKEPLLCRMRHVESVPTGWFTMHVAGSNTWVVWAKSQRGNINHDCYVLLDFLLSFLSFLFLPFFFPDWAPSFPADRRICMHLWRFMRMAIKGWGRVIGGFVVFCLYYYFQHML